MQTTAHLHIIPVRPDLLPCSCSGISVVVCERECTYSHTHTGGAQSMPIACLIIQTTPFTSLTQRGPQPSAHVTLCMFFGSCKRCCFSPFVHKSNFCHFFLKKERKSSMLWKTESFIPCRLFLNEPEFFRPNACT